MAMPRKPDPIKHCRQCGRQLQRKVYNGVLESMHAFLRRKYCDLTCMGKAREAGTINTHRHHARLLMKDACEMCGATGSLDTHHVDLNPANNTPDNVMTLCDTCHTTWHWEHGKTPPASRATCAWCDRPVKGRGLCLKHYQRAKKYGDPHLTAIRTSQGYQVVTAWD